LRAWQHPGRNRTGGREQLASREDVSRIVCRGFDSKSDGCGANSLGIRDVAVKGQFKAVAGKVHVSPVIFSRQYPRR